MTINGPCLQRCPGNLFNPSDAVTRRSRRGHDKHRERSIVIIAGLTGGIASGKSTVSDIFRKAGATIIDADIIAREVVTQGTPAYAEIIHAFGDIILQPDGAIDRKRLGDIIFNAPEKKVLLDAIVHPRVFERMERRIAQTAETTPGAVVILDIPLLLETRIPRKLAEVILVYVPETLQLKRLMQRDAIDKQAALARIHSQMSIEEKRSQATVIIDNSGDREQTRQQALAVLSRLKKG
ncbi:dephospho-CoA kinase [Desulfosarcina ovata]|uniref:dephospho-CoA kinase n=1 Tax=Desulfosarcina ovata TaxID=83564 RepID=UPI0012D356B2|nr:dephospho-CoA kinase [Desulfosarcina ovata]